MVSGGVGQLAANHGEVDVLLSSVLWAFEVVIARRLLRTRSPATLAMVRMGIGALSLIVYLAATGSLGQLAHERRPVALGALDWSFAEPVRGDVDECARTREGG